MPTSPHDLIYAISDANLVFLAYGRPHHVAKTHPHYDTIRFNLEQGTRDADRLIDLIDPRDLVSRLSAGRVTLRDGHYHLDDLALSEAWSARITDDPHCVTILCLRPGDTIAVQGDADAPDGFYIIADLDDVDPDQRCYVECETAEYWGYVATSSIKDIHYAQPS